MYVNPLVGVNQKYNNNLRFQPLDEEIKEEKEFGRNKKLLKNKKKKIGKKSKRKVLKAKQNESENEGSDIENEGTYIFIIVIFRKHEQ